MNPKLFKVVATIAAVGIGGLTYCGLTEKMSWWPFVMIGVVLLGVLGFQKLFSKK